MKFKKENKFVLFYIIIGMAIMFFLTLVILLCIISCIPNLDVISAPFIISVSCLVILLTIIFRTTFRIIKKEYLKKVLRDKFMDGEKVVGYIVNTFAYEYSAGRFATGTSYGLKVLANNKIYIVDGLENNETYKVLENKINDIQINGNTISFEKIPVDVYLKNDDYYVDFENIK